MTNRSWWETAGTRDMPAEDRCEILDMQVDDLVAYITKLEEFMWDLSSEIDNNSNAGKMLFRFIGQEGISLHHEIWISGREVDGSAQKLGTFAGICFEDVLKEWFDELDDDDKKEADINSDPPTFRGRRLCKSEVDAIATKHSGA